jgi:hypothetical protein
VSTFWKAYQIVYNSLLDITGLFPTETGQNRQSPRSALEIPESKHFATITTSKLFSQML